MRLIFPKLCLTIEKWKWNSEYRVYVSNKGHFKNEHKQDLPIKVCNDGYCKVKTNCGFRNAHRIVMLTWKPIPDAENLTVDHLDHNKRNNEVINLEWVTKAENLQRAAADLINITETVADNAVIKTGGLSFSSYTDAAIWARNHHGMTNIELNLVEQRIKKAIALNKMYCGRKWKEVL